MRPANQPTVTVVAVCLKRFDIPGLGSMTEPSRNLIRVSVIHILYQPSMSGAFTASDTIWRLCITVKWSILCRCFFFFFVVFFFFFVVFFFFFFFLTMYGLRPLVWFSSQLTIVGSLSLWCEFFGPYPFPMWPVEPLVPWDSNEHQLFVSL